MNKAHFSAAVSRYKKQRIRDKRFVQSAVLVPMLCKDDELHILLTERTNEVRFHKGQVCFPGGTPMPVDESLLETALRETWEETGVRREDVRIIGELDDNLVRSTGYVITPFVGFIPYPYEFRANEGETDAIFLIPLQVLMDPARFYSQERVIDGHYYYGPLCDYEGHVIWGATARILEHLVGLLPTTEMPESS